MLHLKLQINGFRQLRNGISSLDQTPDFQTLMECLNNELQHQKFYDEFIGLGFKPNQFYMDSDEFTGQEIKKEIDAGIKSTTRLLVTALSLLAPGGALPDDEVLSLWNELCNSMGGKYKDVLELVKKEIEDWKNSNEISQEKFVKMIFLAIQPQDNLTWFGFSPDAEGDNDGFFVDQEFQVISPNG